jgi:hypothetical protein
MEQQTDINYSQQNRAAALANGKLLSLYYC